MGWKSTITMPRPLIESCVRDRMEYLKWLSDSQLCELLELLRGGDGHGYNYCVGESDEDDLRRLELLGDE